MGEDADEPGNVSTARPSLTDLFIADSVGAFSGFYQLRCIENFHELTEYLVGLSCRDQENEDDIELLKSDGDAVLSHRRAEGYRQAKALQKHAVRALVSINAIHEAMDRFHRAVKFHPDLLEAIFDVDTGPPSNLFIPDRIAILTNFFEDADWEHAASVLGRLGELPVHSKLARGRLRNETLRRAIAACRHYWEEIEGHSWTMSNLKEKSVRDEGLVENLKGKCEAFVSDIINLCGIPHGLQDLASSWTAVDISRDPHVKARACEIFEARCL